MLTSNCIMDRAKQHVFPCLIGRPTSHRWLVNGVGDARPIFATVGTFSLSDQKSIRSEPVLQSSTFHALEVSSWLGQVRPSGALFEVLNYFIELGVFALRFGKLPPKTRQRGL